MSDFCDLIVVFVFKPLVLRVRVRRVRVAVVIRFVVAGVWRHRGRAARVTVGSFFYRLGEEQFHLKQKKKQTVSLEVTCLLLTLLNYRWRAAALCCSSLSVLLTSLHASTAEIIFLVITAGFVRLVNLTSLFLKEQNKQDIYCVAAQQLTLKFGEKFLLALSLLALSRSFLVSVRTR